MASTRSLDRGAERHDRGEDLPETSSLQQAQETIAKAQAALAFIENNALTGCEAAMYLLHHGTDVQRIAVARELQFYAADDRELASLITLVTSLITAGETSVEFQASCLQGLEKLLHVERDSATLVRMFDRIARAAEEVDKGHIDEWVNLLRFSITRMREEQILNVALPFVEANLSQTSTKGRQRLLAANVSSALLASIPSVVVPRIWRPFFALSADSSAHVRLAVVTNLHVLSSALGPGTTRTVLFPQLVELMLDENPQVAGSFFRYLLSLNDFFDENFQNDVIVPVLFGYLEQNPPQAIQAFVAEGIGMMAHRFKLNGDAAASARVCRAFRQFALANDDTLRQHAAFNAPAMVHEFRFNPELLQELVDTVGLLATDPAKAVRLRIAAGFDKLCSLLPPCHVLKAKETLRSLFVDGDVGVQQRIAESLPSLCGSFVGSEAPSDVARMQFVASALSFITSYEAKIRSNWRKVKSLLQQFPSLMEFLTATEICCSLLPVLCSHMTYGAAALKDLCAELVVACFRRCVHLKADKTIVAPACARALRLVASSSAHARVSFLVLTTKIVGEMRDDTFIACFERALIKCFDDPIHSVRRRLALCLPSYPRELADVLLDGLAADIDPSVREACRVSKSIVSKDISSQSSSSQHAHSRKRPFDSIAAIIAKVMKELSV